MDGHANIEVEFCWKNSQYKSERSSSWATNSPKPCPRACSVSGQPKMHIIYFSVSCWNIYIETEKRQDFIPRNDLQKRKNWKKFIFTNRRSEAAVKADPLLHLLLKPWFSHIFMFQIFSTLALSCLLTVQAPLPPAQLHLHLERHPSQQRSQERDGYLRAQDRLLFPNEAAGLQTPHAVIFLS